MVEEIDAAAVKISLELDQLLEEYSSLSKKYDELYVSTHELDEIKRKAASYDKIIKRAKEKMNQTAALDIQTNVNGDTSKTSESESIMTDIDHILSDPANQIIDQMRDSQMRFTGAIANMQMETEALKDRINSIINSSKEKILSHIK